MSWKDELKAKENHNKVLLTISEREKGPCSSLFINDNNAGALDVSRQKIEVERCLKVKFVCIWHADKEKLIVNWKNTYSKTTGKMYNALLSNWCNDNSRRWMIYFQQIQTDRLGAH